MCFGGIYVVVATAVKHLVKQWLVFLVKLVKQWSNWSNSEATGQTVKQLVKQWHGLIYPMCVLGLSWQSTRTLWRFAGRLLSELSTNTTLCADPFLQVSLWHGLGAGKGLSWAGTGQLDWCKGETTWCTIHFTCQSPESNTGQFVFATWLLCVITLCENYVWLFCLITHCVHPLLHRRHYYQPPSTTYSEPAAINSHHTYYTRRVLPGDSALHCTASTATAAVPQELHLSTDALTKLLQQSTWSNFSQSGKAGGFRATDRTAAGAAAERATSSAALAAEDAVTRYYRRSKRMVDTPVKPDR
jgi:hypothetical protein